MILREITEVRASPQAIFAFFDQIDTHYLRWHPDHRLFRWTQGHGIAVGNRCYFEETIGGELLKKEVEYTRVEPDRLIEFAPTFWLMRLFLPRLLFRIEPAAAAGVQCVVAELHLRIGPLAAWARRRMLAAVQAHMHLEGINLQRIVEGQEPLIQAPREADEAAAQRTADEARIARLTDASCLEHQLGWITRSLTMLPVDVLWGVLAWHAGAQMRWLLPWLVVRLTIHLAGVRLARRWQPLVHTDPAAGLRLARRFFVTMGGWHALIMPLLFWGTDDVTKLLAVALSASYLGGLILSASGQQRTYWWTALPSLLIMLAGWVQRGGLLGWVMVAIHLQSVPMIYLSIRQQLRAWQTLIRLNDEKQTLAESLVIERDRAEAASAVRTRFFAAASHDLRQPLHALSINATTLDLLARRTGDAQLIDLSQSIARALAQSQGLLDALLDISRLDAGAVKLQWAECDIAQLLRQLQAEHDALARRRGLAFVLDIPDEPCWARTDADQLHRVLRNLLDNALKFTAAGEVRLSLKRAGPQLCISVADTGSGIAPADRERVFEEFYQVGNPARDRSRGLGLGLAIVRRTAALLGAEVRLAMPAIEPGSVFELWLPALETPAPAGVPMPQEVAPQGPVPHVLLVDDEADILDALTGLLQVVGWPALQADTSDAALVLARDPGCRIDIAVVDHRLRQGDGIELIRQLRELRPDLPALLVTGDVAVQGQPPDLGLRVLHKPLAGGQLTAAIRDELAAARRSLNPSLAATVSAR